MGALATRLLGAVAVVAMLLAAAPAQDDVLAVERREDVRSRDALAVLLQKTHADFRLEAMAPRDFCRLLAARLGDKVNFMCSGKPEELAGAAVTLELRGASLWTAMAVAQMSSGLRFVYRSGVVFMVPPAAIKPLTYVVTYDLRAECARLRNFPGPELRLPDGNDDRPLFPAEEESTTTVSGYTAEDIEALLRGNVTPEAWTDGAASLTNTNGLFVVRHSPAGHREVRELLQALGLLPAPRVRVARR